jgi:hypothetical protein
LDLESGGQEQPTKRDGAWKFFLETQEEINSKFFILKSGFLKLLNITIFDYQEPGSSTKSMLNIQTQKCLDPDSDLNSRNTEKIQDF